MLEAVKDEKACLSCYLHPIQTYLDRRLWLHVCEFPLHPELLSAGTQFWQAAVYAMTAVATYQNFLSQRLHPRGTGIRQVWFHVCQFPEARLINLSAVAPS